MRCLSLFATRLAVATPRSLKAMLTNQIEFLSHSDCLTCDPSGVGASGLISVDPPACRIFDVTGRLNQSIQHT